MEKNQTIIGGISVRLKDIFRNRKLLIGVMAAAIIVVVLVFTLIIPRLLPHRFSEKGNAGDHNIQGGNLDLKNLGAIDIAPLIADSTGVNTSSGFKILCENKQTESFFKNTLSISPKTDYDIERISDTEFHINFSEPLKSNSIYRFSLVGYDIGGNNGNAVGNSANNGNTDNSASNNKNNTDDSSGNNDNNSSIDNNSGTNEDNNIGSDIKNESEAERNFMPYYSWAFQTQKSFTLVRTMPRDRSTYVPVDTGIELSFSHEGVEDIEKYFEISPKIDGKFIFHHKTAIFMPEKQLEPGTIYTVIIKKGLRLKGSEEILTEDYIFNFETQKTAEQEISEYLNFTEILYNFTSQREPILDVRASQELLNHNVQVEVYRYSNEKDLLEDFQQYNTPAYRAFGRNNDFKFDTDRLEKITEFETKIMNNQNTYWYESFIIFPSSLPEGHYLVNINSENDTYQTHVQINNMAVYTMAGTKESLVWVNSSDTGKPIEGALVSLSLGLIEGTERVETNTEGIGVIPEKILEDLKMQYKGKLESLSNAQNTKSNLEQQRLFLKISRDKSPVFIVPLQYFNWQYDNYANNNHEMSEKYWSYLYTDRGLYLPDDIVKIWGMVRPRAEKDVPKEGTLSLYRYSYYYDTGFSYGENKSLSEIITTKVKISDLGTFEGSMELSKFNPGSYFMQLRLEDGSEDKIVVEKHFEVSKYTKPAYKIDITTDKNVLFEWEELNIDVQANFFEGSPVSNLELAYSYLTTWDTRKTGNLICNDNGKGSLTVTPIPSTNSWHPLTFNLWMSNAKAEEEEIYAVDYATVFPRDTMIEVKVSSKDKSDKSEENLDKREDKLDELEDKIDESETAHKKVGLIEINTNLINLGKIKDQPKGQYYDAKDYRGERVDIPLLVRIFEQHWEQEETGEYYDFINKKVVKTYRYYEVRTPLQEFEAITSDGGYSYEFPTKDDKNYVIEVMCKDSRGKDIFETVYLYRYSQPYHYGIDRYTLDINDPDETDDHINYDKKFRLGEKVSLEVKKNGIELASVPGNRFLYMTLKNGILTYIVKDDPEVSFDFIKDFIPNIYIKTVYFDGKNVLDVQNRAIIYDYSEQELTIDIKTDKEEYRPGDKVELVVEVKDAKGNPCDNAEVNLSAVDEAFFAVYEQYVNTLSSLYQSCFHSGIIAEYLSYKPLNLDFAGIPEMGGEGGGQGIRSIFKDNAYFSSVRTDSKGKGKTEFILPDNLTSWRITYQGMAYDRDNDSLKAGSGKTNIPVKLPFFVDVIFNDIFMDGDTVSISARSFGSEISKDGEVEYTVVLEKNDTNSTTIKDDKDNSGKDDDDDKNNSSEKIFSSKGKGGNITNIDIGQLETGSYSVTVKAKQGNLNDGLKRDFKVVKNMLEAAKIEKFKLYDGLNFLNILDSLNIKQPEDIHSLITLSLCNEEVSTHYNSLFSLMYSWGERIDQKLTREIAETLMKKYYPEVMEGISDSKSPEFNSYQLYDGGIALLTYDSSNPEITAKIASLLKDIRIVGSNELKKNGMYMNEISKAGESEGDVQKAEASKDKVLEDKMAKYEVPVDKMEKDESGYFRNDLFDSTAMRYYFYKTLDNMEVTTEDAAASFWGLATYNEPVLIDIMNLLKSENTDIGTREKLYLALGLAELGSLKEARNIYEEIIKEHSVSGSPYVYIDSKSSRDDTIELTSLCTVLAIRVNAPERAGLFQYIQDNYTQTILTNIEKLIYLINIVPEAKGKSSFVVEINGKKENIQLEKNKVHKLYITPDGMQNLRFSDVVGNISVTSSYIGGITDFSEDANKLVSVKRDYSIDGVSRNDFKQSSLIKVTLTPEFAENAPDGFYEVTDILPAGMRYVSTGNWFDRRWYPGEVSGQKLVFGYYYNKEAYEKNTLEENKKIVYYVRGVTPGEFTADYSLIKHSRSDFLGFAERVKVNISK